MQSSRWVIAALVIATACNCAGPDQPELEVVPQVDLERYLGTWYEIASYPARFQEGCVATRAQYSLRDDGDIRVINRCRKEALDGPLEEAEGRAEVVDSTTNAKLRVSFFWPFAGDYWIIDLDEDYHWAVVGQPSRKYLWVLSRTPALDEVTYQAILARLPGMGYDPERLQRAEQRTADGS